MKSNLSTIPEWLLQPFFVGSDNDDDDENEDDGNEDEENDDGDEEDSEDDSDDDSDSDDEDDEDDEDEEDPTAGLKSALREERKGRKSERRARIKAEKEARSLKARLDASDGKESDAVTNIQAELETERKKGEGLARTLKSQAVNAALVAEATRQGFIDPEDALSAARQVEADQDEEDPSDIDIDELSVEDAVKKLAKRKPHLLSKKGPPKKAATTKSGTKSTRRRTKSKGGDKEFNPDDYPGL